MSTNDTLEKTQGFMALFVGAFIGILLFNLVEIVLKETYGISPLQWQGILAHSVVGIVTGVFVGLMLIKRSRTEAALVALNNELDRKVRQRTAELNAANQDLKYEISEKNRAQRMLQETLIRQDAILNNIPDMAWLKDKEGNFLAVNEPFAHAAGIDRDELLGKTDFDFWPRDLAQRYIDDDAQVMKTGKRCVREETLVHTADREVWIETIKSPIYDQEGQVIGTTGISRDITERRQMAEALRKRLGN